MRKQLFLIFLFIGLGAFTANSQINRNLVIFEKGTGTWCPHCPGAAMGADDLIANGHPVGVIAYHYSDSYQTNESLSRINYYNITSYPTAVFDGVFSSVGGNHTQSLYANYLPYVNLRLSAQTSFDVFVALNYLGSDQYEAKVFYTKVAGYGTDILKSHFAITESEIQEAWQGMSELNFVMRKMQPNDLGTDVDFSTGDVQVVDYSFTKNATWDSAHIEIVTFLQNNSSKEIVNGAKRKLHQLVQDNIVGNFGSNTTEVETGGSVMFSDVSTGDIGARYWYFPGGNPQTSNLKYPLVQYDTAGIYDVQLILTNGFYHDTVLMEDYIEVTEPVGISESISKKNVDIHPNPVKDVLTLEFNMPMNDIAQIKIKNILGETIQTFKPIPVYMGESKHTLHLRNVEDGIYLVEVTFTEKTLYKKIIMNQ